VTTAAVLLLALAGAAAAVNWWAVAGDRRRVEYVAKPLTMLALVAVAVALDPADETRRWWFVAAGAFSLGGDVFLMLPRERFVSGLLSFLVAHVCYVAGLLSAPVAGGGAALGVVVVAAGGAVVGRRIVTEVRRDKPSLFVPVVVYAVVISAMVVTAFATRLWAAVAGAMLFYASDGVLAWRRFVQPVPHGRVVIMVTYHLGQAGLILSLATGG
jgi:uncharacterized membrane protein YhhN